MTDASNVIHTLLSTIKSYDSNASDFFFFLDHVIIYDMDS